MGLALVIFLVVGCRRPPSSITDQKAALIGTWHTGRVLPSKIVFSADGNFEWSYDTGPGTLGMPPDAPVTTTGLAGTYAEERDRIVVTVKRYVFRSPDAATEQQLKGAIEQYKKIAQSKDRAKAKRDL